MKNMPLDDNGRAYAVGTAGFSTGFNANGNWQAVSIPAGEEAKRVRINLRADDTAIYTHIDGPLEFHFSFNSDGTFFDWCPGIEFSLGKDAAEVVCYVRGTNGYKFVITGIK
jgi:hypothetical protein